MQFKLQWISILTKNIYYILPYAICARKWLEAYSGIVAFEWRIFDTLDFVG